MGNVEVQPPSPHSTPESKVPQQPRQIHVTTGIRNERKVPNEFLLKLGFFFLVAPSEIVL